MAVSKKALDAKVNKTRVSTSEINTAAEGWAGVNAADDLTEVNMAVMDTAKVNRDITNSNITILMEVTGQHACEVRA